MCGYLHMKLNGSVHTMCGYPHMKLNGSAHTMCVYLHMKLNEVYIQCVFIYILN